MSYDNKVQDFILYENNLTFIDKQILRNLLDIPLKFGEFQRIRDISDKYIIQEISKKIQLNKLQQQILLRSESPQQERIVYLKHPELLQQQPIFRNSQYSNQIQQELNLFRQQNNREKSLIKQLQTLPKYSNAVYSKQRQRELNLIKQLEGSNLYYTDNRFDIRIGTKSTSHLHLMNI